MTSYAGKSRKQFQFMIITTAFFLISCHYFPALLCLRPFEYTSAVFYYPFHDSWDQKGQFNFEICEVSVEVIKSKHRK